MNRTVPPLRVEHLSKSYRSKQGTVFALRDLNFQVEHGHSIALVGESGCGKTTAAYCIAGIQPADSGNVFIAGQDFSSAPRARQRELRRNFGIVFQNPLSALNPRMCIWQSVAEPVRVHEPSVDTLGRRQRALAMLALVGLGEQHSLLLPGALSGGQLQRVVLARALILNPKLVILDEPTSALDVSIQAQMLNLLQDLRDTMGLCYLFITHNLALVEVLTDVVMVMYAGRVVEAGPVDAVFTKPMHPYTQELIQSVPDLATGRQVFKSTDMDSAQAAAPSGCAYRLRCPRALADCARIEPALERHAHDVACFHPIN